MTHQRSDRGTFSKGFGSFSCCSFTAYVNTCLSVKCLYGWLPSSNSSQIVTPSDLIEKKHLYSGVMKGMLIFLFSADL